MWTRRLSTASGVSEPARACLGLLIFVVLAPPDPQIDDFWPLSSIDRVPCFVKPAYLRVLLISIVGPLWGTRKKESVLARVLDPTDRLTVMSNVKGKGYS